MWRSWIPKLLKFSRFIVHTSTYWYILVHTGTDIIHARTLHLDDALAAFLRQRVSTARLTWSSCLALFQTAVSATERHLWTVQISTCKFIQGQTSMYWYVLVCTGMYLTISAEKVLILWTKLVHHNLHNMCNTWMMKPEPSFCAPHISLIKRCALFQAGHHHAQHPPCTSFAWHSGV